MWIFVMEKKLCYPNKVTYFLLKNTYVSLKFFLVTTNHCPHEPRDTSYVYRADTGFPCGDDRTRIYRIESVRYCHGQ